MNSISIQNLLNVNDCSNGMQSSSSQIVNLTNFLNKSSSFWPAAVAASEPELLPVDTSDCSQQLIESGNQSASQIDEDMSLEKNGKISYLICVLITVLRMKILR